MLRLITGRIGSGKTNRIHEKIKEAVLEGESVMLIVPEQYSFCTEKQMLSLLGAEGADKVQVVSFSFLAQTLLKKYGINTNTMLDDSTRAMLMSLALESVKDRLQIYGKYCYSSSVITKMLKTLKDFRQEAVTADMLRKSAVGIDNSLLKNKILEIALVGEVYTYLVENSYFDEESALDRLCDVLNEHKNLDGMTVFIDGFRGYTGQEIKVLESIFSQAKDVYITLCTDINEEKDDFSAFAHTRRTRQKLIKAAKKSNIKIAPPEHIEKFDEKRYLNDELPYLERGLYSHSFEKYEGKTENIIICSAEDFQSECEFAAHTVKKLIREDGLRCRDIAIISRSEKDYARQMRSELIKNGVPVYNDRRQSIAAEPLIEFVCSSLDIAVNGFSCDSIMRVLKTGLTDLSVEEISELENYALMWQINGKRWLEEWTSNPGGLGERFGNDEKEALRRINKAREKATEPLKIFRFSLKDADGLKAAKSIYALLVNMNVPENLKKLAENLNNRGETELAEEQGRIWDILIEIIDRISEALVYVKLEPSRLAELFNLIISMYTIGTLPQGLDEIVIGSADRVKTTAPKVVFAMGVNDGLFPMIPQSDGILSDNEKKLLADIDLKTDDSLEEKMMEEHFIAYSTLCSPSEKLYVTYSRRDVTGAQMTPSELISSIRQIFPQVTVKDTACTPLMDFVEGEKPAFELMARLTNEGGTMYSTLKEYFEKRPEYAGKLAALRRASSKEEFRITDTDTAKKLFGMDMYMSASRTEVYNKCPFEYFCKYGINAKPRKTAELDPMQKGTAIHYILEKLIERYTSEGLCTMPKEERDQHVHDILKEYFYECLDSDGNLGARFYYLFSQLGKIVCEVVDRLVTEFGVSEFVPVAFELSIDKDGEVPTYDIPLDDGGMIRLKGSVDRVDVMKTEGTDFVRVVDYKSSGKKFSLNEVYSGLNMQMLIYLFAIWKHGFREYRNIVPAGILYMPVNAPYAKFDSFADAVNSDAYTNKQKQAKLNGMILDDSRVIYGMDSRGEGDIVPVKISKKGDCKGTLISLKQMELLMQRVEKILADMATSLHEGIIHVRPAVAASSSSPYKDVCKYCDYKDVCLKDENTPVNEIENVSHNESLEELGGEKNA